MRPQTSGQSANPCGSKGASPWARDYHFLLLAFTLEIPAFWLQESSFPVGDLAPAQPPSGATGRSMAKVEAEVGAKVRSARNKEQHPLQNRFQEHPLLQALHRLKLAL